jgi:hypothetical protein
MPPQPLLTWPPHRPSQLRATQMAQTLAEPGALQISGASQLPQSTVPPQPSLTEPQLRPRSAHVCGVQHWLP